jgi:CheY-like chemotaxis protein
MEVLSATNGRQAVQTIQNTPEISCVLMDIMMPEMDGYEAISEIRKMDNFERLPIIALTAKAMKADRDHCLDVGASDYISKPLDIDQLFSLLRVWLSPENEDL